MFALVDCNNFYVSCEKVFAPNLEGRPVVVLSNNDGCIISRSQEAKDLGFKMAEPIFQRKDFVAEHNVTVFSSNYALYGDMSNRVARTLAEFSPKIEVYSIDECFLDLSGSLVDLFSLGQTIKKTVLKNTGIPVGVGIAPTKALSKIANHLAKKQKQYKGVCIINTEEEREAALKATPIGDVWGIGRQFSKKLLEMGILTAFGFIQINDQWIKKNMTIQGLRLKRELMGESCMRLEELIPDKQAIATTRAFGKKTADLQLIMEAVATYSTRCAEKLRRQNSVARYITVFIHTDPFNKNEQYFYRTQTIVLPIASNNQFEISKHAIEALKYIFKPGLLYKKAGVIVSDISPATYIQGNLFQQQDIRQNHLSKVMDSINSKYGRDTVKMAIQGSGRKWKLRQEQLSPRYTTCWSDLIKINAR